MTKRVEGKIAVVTGGAAGMGRAHARLLASEGARVVVTDVDAAGGRETVALIQGEGGTATFVEHDVSKAKDWESVVGHATEEYGRIDVLVNNAGILAFTALQDTEEEVWDRIFAVNAKGTYLGCKAVLPAMQRSTAPSIINISSMYGIIGAPNAAAYEASKGAVRTLTKAAAVDFKEFGIRVNSVHPGVIATAMTNDILADAEGTKALLGTTILDRPGQPEEVSAVVLFLASDESSFMNGSEVVVDGGYIAQ
ncbi:glucose 1-dehydrogenase [Sinomonas sp. ASV486]|uniref:SDR family NAD(P)-dependent oxidoreductase n=1 Tax=Sinomonas sp. ASV486 TaxID=3051170 RepID=UPI0027DB1986|nr:glucose 1-dehydrogenase [Sinomonas sp. ASV486]MDQ4489519.1 glucose 1-dehydrogenase [Sinomonas sp. ASV486]